MTKDANWSKGAKGPEEWRPPDEGYWCEYAVNWTEVKAQWGLTMTREESRAVLEMLEGCQDSVKVLELKWTAVSEPTEEPENSVYRSCGDAESAGGAAGSGESGRRKRFPEGDGAIRPGRRRGWCSMRTISVANRGRSGKINTPEPPYSKSEGHSVEKAMTTEDNQGFVSRSGAIGFAQRTRKNLKHVREAFESGEDLHVVTQLVNPLLGIVVVPKAQYFEESFLSVRLEKLYKCCWPEWDITLDEPRGKTRKPKP